ncbi:MAG: GGGtGRT protein, partial [Syntrophaceae bacterium]|nr:GGGtGRT protein [Syntrophaceae bacterium]
MALFEGYERRIKQITPFLAKYGISSLEEAEKVCLEKGVDVRKIVKEIQPISFENAGWAYLVGAAAAIKKGQKTAADIAETLGEGLQSFCIPGSVADDRQVGIGHGNLASMLLR